LKKDGVDFVNAGMIKAIWSSIGVRDEEAAICTNNKGIAEPDTSLRDSETIPLKDDIQKYFKREVLPHVPDAYIDETTLNKIGYEIPFTRHFYKYEKLRGFEKIMKEISDLEVKIQEGIKAVLS
jgi:type I restriction enzyme M protein